MKVVEYNGRHYILQANPLFQKTKPLRAWPSQTKKGMYAPRLMPTWAKVALMGGSVAVVGGALYYASTTASGGGPPPPKNGNCSNGFPPCSSNGACCPLGDLCQDATGHCGSGSQSDPLNPGCCAPCSTACSSDAGCACFGAGFLCEGNPGTCQQQEAHAFSGPTTVSFNAAANYLSTACLMVCQKCNLTYGPYNTNATNPTATGIYYPYQLLDKGGRPMAGQLVSITQNNMLGNSLVARICTTPTAGFPNCAAQPGQAPIATDANGYVYLQLWYQNLPYYTDINQYPMCDMQNGGTYQYGLNWGAGDTEGFVEFQLVGTNVVQQVIVMGTLTAHEAVHNGYGGCSCL